MWPQIVVLIALASSLGYCIVKNGQVVNVTKLYAVSHTAFVFLMLYFGGFWNTFGVPQTIMLMWYTIVVTTRLFAPSPAEIEVVLGRQLIYFAIVFTVLWWGGFWSVLGF